MKELFTHPGSFILGDSIEVLCDLELVNAVDFLFLDPPYDSLDLALKAICLSGLRHPGAMICFMYTENIRTTVNGFDQVCFWTKPVSTKNTSKQYSRFVEAICIWHNEVYFNKNLHWSTRTGVFTDTLIEKQIHPHQKPFSLVEKLVLLHTPPGGTVLDPFCGSQVVKQVCDKHGFKSLSIDLKDWLETLTLPTKRDRM
jgi:DNA modification methylase